MHPRLVGHLNRDAEIAEQRVDLVLGPPLCLLAQIFCVKVENVVVLDAEVRSLLVLQVPHRLKQAARNEPGIRKAQFLPSREDVAIHRVARNIANKGVLQCVSHAVARSRYAGFTAFPGFRWVTPKSTSARPVICQAEIASPRISQAAISVSTGPRLPKVAAWAASVAEIGLARLQRSEIPGRP